MSAIAEATPLQRELARAHAERMARFFPGDKPQMRRIPALPPALAKRRTPIPRTTWPAYMPAVWYDSFVPEPDLPHSWRFIATTTAAKHRLTLADLLGPVKIRRISNARQEAFYRIGHETNLSLPQIGERMHRDHTTVLHGIRKHAERFGLPNRRTA